MRRGFVRIIAGKWRGRSIKIASIRTLRPTPDRVRETLFNWLTPVIQNAKCLDLFSGSGALGFEALSRGARQVTMVDHERDVIKMLRAQQQIFEADNAHIYQAKIPKQLRWVDEPYDIVFIDPPYHKDLLIPTCHYLAEHEFLAETAYIYLEAHEVIKDNDLPKGWHVIKKGRAGEVAYHLVLRESE